MIAFFVPGIPAPGGSKRAFVVSGKARLVDDAKGNRAWRAVVALAARVAHQGAPLAVPLALDVTFVLPRPKGHHGARGLRPSAPRWPAVRPDATKLLRALEDALTGVIYADDSLIVEQHVRKAYGAEPGAHITVTPLEAA